MKPLKKYFETQEGCDEVEFRQVGWFMPLSVVLAIGYVVIAIILYVLGAYTMIWQDIVSVCIMVLMMTGVLLMGNLLYRRVKHNQTFTRKSIRLIRNIGFGLNICMMIIFVLSFSHILRDPLLLGMYVLVLLLQELIELMAIILVKGETIQKEQDLTI